MNRILRLSCFIILLAAISCSKESSPGKDTGSIQLISVKAGNSVLDASNMTGNVPADLPFYLSFTVPVDTNSLFSVITLSTSGGMSQPYRYSSGSTTATIILTPVAALGYLQDYTLDISSGLRGTKGETFTGARFSFSTQAGTMVIDSISLNGKSFGGSQLIDADPAKLIINVTFSRPLNPDTYESGFSFDGPALAYSLSSDRKTVTAGNTAKAEGLKKYTFSVSSALTSADGYTFAGYSTDFYTGVDSTYKYPEITDDDLLTLVQRQTFKYFWDFGHPVSGMARERNTSGDVVTTGGTGFGIMAMVVAMERGFISRAEGLGRLDKILGFLETCDRFHGAWPHWLDGSTGKTVPFSPTENGGDLVETSYMMEGLLTMRQYLDSTVAGENNLINRINALFDAIEFDWYTNGQNVLYWEWSPDYGYNLKIEGYNETLITYVIAASSPTHTVTADTYTMGYARNGAIKNGDSYYGYLLPLGPAYGGPLFFTHYTFLGLDPRNLSDQYANYMEQNVNQSLINWTYCQSNPKKYPGYVPGIWGLTASDNPWGYNAHSPANDLGVVAPTAAISSIAYTPVQSMDALRTFYYFLGDHLWGEYGFYDAFDVKEGWWANSTLAIDQGPIICMIENYRTGLLWDLFMSSMEIKAGLTKLGFSY